jgi:hypothetical protein
MGVDTTTFLADLKFIYGEIQSQVSTKAMLMNLFEDGTKMAKPSSDIGGRGYTFLARLTPNWAMGYRAEGYTGVGAASNQGLQNSTVLLKYAYVPVTVTGQAENLSKGNSRAFMQAKALETKYDMEDIVSHVNVVVAGAERGGQLAQVAAAPAPAAGTFSTDATALLPGANYLRVGMPIDIGPVGGGVNSITNATILTINYATGAVTHSGGTATAGQAIYLAGESGAAGGFPYTSEGLQSLVSNSATTIQGLNPSTAGQTAWQAYVVDNANVAISSPFIQSIIQFVQNRSGQVVDVGLWSSAQINQLTAIATQVMQFQTAMQDNIGKRALDLGFVVYEYAGRPIVEDKDIRYDRFFWGAGSMMKKFEAIPLSMAEDEASTWTRVSGANGIADAVQGLLRWYHAIGTLQRNSWGVGKNCLVPTTFVGNPPTI